MNDTEKNFSNKLAEVSNLVNKALKVFLPKDNSLISQTMRYAVLNGGKRLRPALVIWTAQMLGQTIKNILPAACALEYLHTYSLVHDDLPAMDNDDLRRSKPTVHKKFNYAAAILCGDALLTESFNLIVRAKASDQSVREAVYILSQYGGFKQMIGGQVEDTFETGNWNKKSRGFLLKKLKEIQLKKTAALICASLKIGAVLSNADKKTLRALEIYGKNLGCAFQIIDDILDVYGDKKLLGKRGSDADNNKLTALSLFSKEEAFACGVRHIKLAKNALKDFGVKAEIFRELADFVLERGF